MRRVAGSIFAALLISCDRSGGHRLEQIPTTARPRALGAAVVGFDQVQPLFAKFCSECHPARSGPDWLNYNQALGYVKNGRLRRRVVEEKTMPAVGSPQAVSMTEADRSLIDAWVAGGGAATSAAASENTASTANTSGKDQLINRCLQCHGKSGPGQVAQPKVPRLAGQNAEYLQVQLNRFAWRKRIDPSNVMNDIASELTPGQIQRLSDFFASQPGFIPKGDDEVRADEALLARGSALANNHCISCHMNPAFNLRSNDPRVPVLTNQSEQYLRNQLIYFRDDERASSLMSEYARPLSDNDILALAHFFAFIRL